MMHVDLYTDNLYSSKIRIQDSRIAAEYTGSISSMTISDVTYKYVQGGIITSLITDVSGSEIANCVSDPAGDANTYRYYYLKGGMRIRCKAYYFIESVNTWRYVLDVGLFAGTAQLCGYGISTYTTVNPATNPENYSIRFVSIKKDTDILYGFAFTDSPSSYIMVTAASENFYNQSLSPRYDGGSAGSDPQSGYGDNDTANSATTRATNPGSALAASGSHGLHAYQMDGTAISGLYGFVWQKDALIAIERTITKPLSGIISIHKMPVIASRTGTAVTEYMLAGWVYQSSGGTILEDTQNVYLIESDPIYVGTLQNDFADFEATTAILHLPFCGTYPIDIKSIMGGYVRLVYMFDILQGNCVCNVYTTARGGYERLYGSYSGNCAYMVPVSGNEQGAANILGMISTVAGIASVAASGAASAAAAASPAAMSAISAMSSGAITQGNAGGNSAYYSHMIAELYIYRPKAVYPDRYAHQIGRPTGCAGTVGSYSGYLSGTVHADTIAAATEEERREIESTIAGGVFV